MTTFALTLNGKPFSVVTEEAALLAGIARVRDLRNAGVQEHLDDDAPNPAFIRTDADYVQDVMASWASHPHVGELTADTVVTVADQAMRSWAGLPVEMVPPTAPTVAVDIDALKLDLGRRVDASAEACRMQFLSPGGGQALTYVEKHNEALAIHDMGEAAANAMSDTARRADFPALAASVGIEAKTLWDCSQGVLKRYLQFAAISYEIERAKLAGKQLISLASDAAAAQAAYEAITWPKP